MVCSPRDEIYFYMFVEEIFWENFSSSPDFVDISDHFISFHLSSFFKVFGWCCESRNWMPKWFRHSGNLYQAEKHSKFNRNHGCAGRFLSHLLNWKVSNLDSSRIPEVHSKLKSFRTAIETFDVPKHFYHTF